jgi:hypothetical protein
VGVSPWVEREEGGLPGSVWVMMGKEWGK